MSDPNKSGETMAMLEACPFCGHPESVSLDRYNGRLAYVECLGCSAHGPAKDHEQGAIKAWNTRAAIEALRTPEPEAAVEELANRMLGKADEYWQGGMGFKRSVSVVLGDFSREVRALILRTPEPLKGDAVAMCRLLIALSHDCDNTDGWQDAAPDLRDAAAFITAQALLIEGLERALQSMVDSCTRTTPALHDDCGTRIIGAPTVEALKDARAALTRSDSVRSDPS